MLLDLFVGARHDEVLHAVRRFHDLAIVLTGRDDVGEQRHHEDEGPEDDVDVGHLEPAFLRGFVFLKLGHDETSFPRVESRGWIKNGAFAPIGSSAPKWINGEQCWRGLLSSRRRRRRGAPCAGPRRSRSRGSRADAACCRCRSRTHRGCAAASDGRPRPCPSWRGSC